MANSPKRAKVLALVLIIAYFAVRLPSLNLQPVFCDEGIYIRWAQKIAQNPKLNLFIPLTDGKTPLFMWIAIPFLKFIKDPLIAGRTVSILSGFLTFTGAVYLGKRFFDFKTSLISAILFIFTPFIVFFDRMALTDSMLAAFSFWSLILTLDIVKSPSFKKTLLLGLSLGFSILTKTPGMFNFINLPLTLITLNLKDKNKLKKSTIQFAISALIGLALYNLLKISPYFENLSKRNSDYHFTPSHLLQTPLDSFLGNIKLAFEFLSKMVTIPIFLLFIFTLIYSIYKKKKLNIIIFLWGFLPFLILTSLLKVYTARYILPSVVPFIFLSSLAIAEITKKIKFKAMILAFIITILVPSFIFDYHLLKSPQKANLPQKEKEGYFEGWTAGYGLKEMADFLKQESKEKNILLVTAGAFGTLPDGIGIYLFNEPKIQIWYSNSNLEPYIYEAAKEKTAFFLIHKSNLTTLNPNLKLIKEIPKPNWKEIPSDFLLLYQIENQ